MAVDPTQPIPIYFQLKTLLLEEILEGRYGTDGRLPTEHELCARFAISRTPVSRALTELADDGVILRHRRRGTFVNPHGLRRTSNTAEVRVVVSDPFYADVIATAAPADTQVTVVTVPLTSLHDTLMHAVAEGRAPDLALLDSIWIAEFAASGFLHAIEDLDRAWIRGEHDDDFLEPLVASNRIDDRTYAVSAFGSVAGLWYRRDVLDACGLEPPETWDELRSVGHALAAAGHEHPFALPGGSRAGETTTYCLVAVLASNGARVLDDDAIQLDSAATAETLAFLRQLIDDGIVAPDVVRYEWTHPIRLLAERKAVLSLGGSYEAQTLATALGMPIADLWELFGFIPFPAGPRGRPASVAGSMSYAIFRQAAQPHLALRVLERAVAAPTLARLAEATGRLPGRRSAVELAAPALSFVSQSAAILDAATTRPKIPLYPRVSRQLQTMLEAALTGRLGAARAAAHTADLIEAITGLPVHRTH